MKKKFKILCFFGTRPEAIKMAPVVKELIKEPRFQVIVTVSAQHRDMLDQVLRVFKLKSHMDLDVMREKQSLFDVTSRIIQNFEPVLDKTKPDLVLVHGDTTTTLCGTLAAYYKRIPVGHVEAGLRTHDLYRPFPEEANRHLTDALTTLYFPPTAESKRNLLRENVPSKKIFVTGNTVIDALLETRREKSPTTSKIVKQLLARFHKDKTRLILMTAHRRENFGRPFRDVLAAVQSLGQKFPDVHWIYPVHPNPNVQGPARQFLRGKSNIHLMDPLEYNDLVRVMDASTLVVTDSGGLQEEAPSLGKPVIVLRDVTERPEAVRAGTVKLVGTDKNKIVREVSRLLSDKAYYRHMANAVNPYGDGHAAERIAQAVRWTFGFSRRRPADFKGR